MSSATNPKSGGDQGDPWEQLAEDLFGLEYGKEHGSREPSPAVAEPVAPPVVSHQPTAPPQRVHVEERHEPAVVTSPVEVEPPHRHDEPGEAVEQAVVETVGFEAEVSSEKGETSQPAAGAASPQDSYWDALA